MGELYPGIPGSPITYLAGDISAGQTTIAIGDDTALPDAPNICTIGYGEHIETIKYEAKSNGVLQNVTRGIEGTPRAWQAGTEVARFFTAHDHITIIDKITENANNLATHQAESASKHITESGENENGRYIKFDDGTMICTGDRVFTDVQVTSALGALYYATSPQTSLGVYPATFYQDAPNVSLIASNTQQATTWIGAYTKGDTTTLPLINVIRHVPTVIDELTVSFIAIGRWK